MQIVECKDEKEWVEAANRWLTTEINKWSARRVFIPAGETPRPLYSSWQKHKIGGGELSSILKQLTFVQLDEIINAGSPFRNFFVEAMPDYLGQIEFIEDAERGADLALLGLGLNGHVAFHEPGISNKLYSGCLNLSASTAARLNISTPARGQTYGIDAFMKTRGVCLLVRGLSKREILKTAIQASSDLPAAEILKHKNATVITDFKV